MAPIIAILLLDKLEPAAEDVGALVGPDGAKEGLADGRRLVPGTNEGETVGVCDGASDKPASFDVTVLPLVQVIAA